jgi:hypothetical protein
MGVSLKPSEAVEGGGLLDDVDVKVVEAKFAMFDYNGTATPVPAILLKLDAMDDTEPLLQYFSVGKALDWMPSDDGKELVPIGKATQLVSSSNGMLLLQSIVNAGFPESKLGDDISVLEGMECHVNRIAAPVRKGLTQKEGKTILTITKIHKYPWEDTPSKGKAKSSKGSKVAKAKPKTQEATVDAESATTDFILGVLTNEDTMSKYPDGIPKVKLVPEAFSSLKSTDPNRQVIIKKVLEDDFLNAGPWVYESGKLSIG